MILTSSLTTHEIALDNDEHPVLVIENPTLLMRFVSDLLLQSEGADRGFVLSESWVPLDFAKSVAVITDLFTLDVNSKKTSTALLKQITNTAITDELFQSTHDCMETISDWAFRLESEMEYAVCHDPIQDISPFIKAIGFHFDNNISIPERICMLLKTLSAYLSIRLIVIPWLHDCISVEDMELIYKTATYQDTRILTIESHLPEHKLSSEKLYIIDRDLCDL